VDEHEGSEGYLRMFLVRVGHYTKTAQFYRLYLFSSAYGKPTKTTKLVRRPTQANEIKLIFVGLVTADETKVIFSSA
jgi:hypothetical protein